MEKITLKWIESDKFEPLGNTSCSDMSPEGMILYSMALSTGRTAASIFSKQGMGIYSFIIEISGQTDNETGDNRLFSSVNQVFHIGCDNHSDIYKILENIEKIFTDYSPVTSVLAGTTDVTYDVFINGEVFDWKYIKSRELGDVFFDSMLIEI